METDVPIGAEPEVGDGYDAVIVGAGIGGLACGALLAKEGLKVLVSERRDRPGGYASLFEEKGYLFQVPHLIGGCSPSGGLTRVIDHLGLKVDFKNVDPFHRYIYPDHDISVPCDIEKYKEVLKENFQPQTNNINRFFKAISDLQNTIDLRLVRRAPGASIAIRRIAYPLLYPRLFRWSRATYQKLLDSFLTDDRLKTAISTPWPLAGAPPWELSAVGMAWMMGAFRGGAYFPIGGYQAISNEFARALVDNGGTLALNHEVGAITVSQGAVAGVVAGEQSEIKTGIVVSDVDTKRTFLRLISPQNLHGSFLEGIKECPMSVSGFVMHLGMNHTIDDPGLACGSIFIQPSYEVDEMLEEVRAIDRYPDPGKIRWFMMVHSLQDPSLAPGGKTCLEIVVPSVPYDFMDHWGVEEGRRSSIRYRHIKDEYAEVVVEAVRKTFPDLLRNVEAYDISTPVTFERITMATDGCWFDTAQAPGLTFMRRLGPTTPVEGLYLTGSKAALGAGIYGSVMNGVLAADSILKGKLGRLLT